MTLSIYSAQAIQFPQATDISKKEPPIYHCVDSKYTHELLHA